jgi:hypothetical protein
MFADRQQADRPECWTRPRYKEQDNASVVMGSQRGKIRNLVIASIEAHIYTRWILKRSELKAHLLFSVLHNYGFYGLSRLSSMVVLL